MGVLDGVAGGGVTVSPPSTDAPRRMPNTGRVMSVKVPDERGIQDTAPGNPGVLLRTVTLPVDEVLVPQAAVPHIYKAMGRPRRMVVDDPGWRWGRSGGRQRVGGDGQR